MSLVEKALKKMQIAQQSGPEPSRKQAESFSPVGTVVQRDQDMDQRSRARTDKLIKIDRVALRAAGLLPPEQQERRVANEYRAIKRPLVSAALGRGVERIPNGHLVMLASALPGEGKTFTSMNLALSMALEKDITVLLVDADLAKPHISRTFGVQEEPGLLDALLNPALDVESLVIPTDIPGLSILPAGKSVETATELLSSSRMEQIAAQLGRVDSNRIVLVDSPPLLLTSESKAIATVVGQIVLVVRAEHTQRSAVIEALSCLREDKVVSVVLNQSETPPAGEYYGYGDTYGTKSE